jgi:membrane-associated phospholipid phosphatase
MLTPSVRLRLFAAVGWIVVVVAVAFSRVEVGVHWTTDVLASVVFATAWLLFLGMLFGAVVVSGGSRSGQRLAT